jgi:hypothetical protein
MRHCGAPYNRGNCSRPQAGDIASKACRPRGIASHASRRPQLVVPWLVTRASVWCLGNLAREIFLWSPIGTTGLDCSHDESLLRILVFLCLHIIINATRSSDPKSKDVHHYKTMRPTSPILWIQTVFFLSKEFEHKGDRWPETYRSGTLPPLPSSFITSDSR